MSAALEETAVCKPEMLEALVPICWTAAAVTPELTAASCVVDSCSCLLEVRLTMAEALAAI